MFESLEKRSLMSVDMLGETLTITTGSANDTILVTQAEGQVHVTENGIYQGAWDVNEYGPDKTEIEIHVGAGSDTVTLDASVTLESEIYGEAGHDTITGGSGQDRIDAGSGNDLVHGGADDDAFVNANPPTGALAPSDRDEYFGDEGTEDRIIYHGRPTGVSVRLNDVADDGYAPIGNPGGLSPEMDNVHSDVENVSGTDSPDFIIGNSSSNNISGNGGADTIYGSSGGDTLFGGSGNDVIYGNHGGDWMRGDGGSDYLFGGEDDDTLRGGASPDTMWGDAGTDLVEYEGHAAAVTVRLDGLQNDGSAGENDYIKNDVENASGTQFNDKLYGSPGANRLDGKNGNDSMYGMSGNDTMVGGFGADLFVGGLDKDTADYTYAIGALTIDLDDMPDDGIAGEGDNVQSSVENVIGGFHNDTIIGNSFSNTLIGGGGNDTLIGMDGADELFGGIGDDSLDGGGGADTLWGEAGLDTLVGGPGNDVENQ